MNLKPRTALAKVAWAAVLVLPLLLAARGDAQVQYLRDGAIPNAQGGWDLPSQGTCPAGALNGYAGIDTRPECVGLRLATTGPGAVTCVAPNYSSTTSGVCNDLVNNTQPLCAAQAANGRLWNPSTGICSITMMDDDRNNVICATLKGTWVTTATCTGAWVMPATTAYTPTLLTSNSPGDQCLRCHNSRTQYNSARVRDTEDTLYMGHKNMARVVAGGRPWGGPPFFCSLPAYTSEESCFDNGGTWDPTIYPSDDSGNAFNWAAGTITVGGVAKNLYWIYADWISALPRAIYATDPVAGKPGVSYSCARCHTTGWTSDATLKANKEPSATFGSSLTWDGVTAPVTGQVNLASGVTGDTNKMASWDVFGISCARCHSAAVSDTGSLPRSGVSGMSSHHSNLTAPDAGSGVCSDSRFTSEAACAAATDAFGAAAPGQWLTACSVNPTAAVCTQAITTSASCVLPGVWVSAVAGGWCSDTFYTTSATCTANGFVWQDGWCTRPDKNSSALCTGGTGTNALTWRLNGTQQSCQASGADWTYSKCNVEGFCNKGTNVTTKAGCDAIAGSQFAYATDVVRCEDAGGRWTGNNAYKGPIITSVCMSCHRQETGGLPYNDLAATPGTDLNTVHPGSYVKVGVAHGNVVAVSHPHGNQFLNSPHGKFTGTFNQIGTGKFNYALTGEYKSYFQTEGEQAGVGNGCTGCHEVHTSTVAGEKPFRAECTECHAGPYAVDLGSIKHAAGIGTPLENADTEPSEACAVCHMPNGMHDWRINASAGYSTFPRAAARATDATKCATEGGTWNSQYGCIKNANTRPDGLISNAVWIDVDLACGQCHGGGLNQVNTTGTMVATQKTVTVASAVGMAVGQHVRVTGAGSLYYDDDGAGHTGPGQYADLDAYISAIAGNVVTLTGPAIVNVTNVAVVQNPTKNGAQYRTKNVLGQLAYGMHSNANTPPPQIRISYSVAPATPLQVTVNGSTSYCGNWACDNYNWDFGDGTTATGAGPIVHTFTANGTYVITLEAESLANRVGGVATQKVTVAATVPNPTVAATCNVTQLANNWTLTIADNGSSVAAGTTARQVTVNWGDGTAVSSVVAPPAINLATTSFSHQFLAPPQNTVFGTYGGYTAKYKVVDSLGHSSTATCLVANGDINYFTYGGTVTTNAAAPLPLTALTLKLGTKIMGQMFSDGSGLFSFPNLKPGTYTLTATKTGYTFNPVTVVLGPSNTTATVAAN